MAMPQESGQMRPHLPSQDELAVLGEISVRHGYLDFVLRLTIRDLAQFTNEEADKALWRTSSAGLRDLVEQHATRRLGEAHFYLPHVKAMLQECQEVTEQRNRLVHDPLVRWYEEDGPPGRYRNGVTLKLPEISELKALADRIHLLAAHLDRDRLKSLAVALSDLFEEKLLTDLREEKLAKQRSERDA